MKSGTHVLLRGFSPSRFCSPSPPLQDPSWACGSLTTLPPVVDPARYRLTSIDIVHVALSAAVFRVVAARDKNVVGCFYGPSPAKETAQQRCSTYCRSALACSAACPSSRSQPGATTIPVTNSPNSLILVLYYKVLLFSLQLESEYIV
jgi:hypothetical protein